MSKVDLSNLAPGTAPLIRGAVVYKENFGGATAQAWPKKRPNWASSPMADWCNRFGFAGNFAANALPIDLQAAIGLAKGTEQVPRDLLTQAALGRLWIIVNEDGTEWGHVLGPTTATPQPPPPEPYPDWVTSWSGLLNSISLGWNGYTLRQVIRAAALTNVAGDRNRVTFQPASTDGFHIAAAYIGLGATTGSEYNFAATPTQLLFAGSAAVTTAAGINVTSDPVDFAIGASRNVVISLYFAGASGVERATGPTNVKSYYKAGNSAATLAPGAMTASVAATCVNKLESH